MMTTRQAKHKSPDAPPPPAPPILSAPAESDEVANLKAEIVRLRGLLKWHVGKDFSE